MKASGRHKIRWAALLFPLVTLPFLTGREGGFSADPLWQKIDEGFEVRSAQLNEQPYQTPIKLTALRLAVDKYAVRVLDSRDFGTDRMEIKTLAKRARALAAVNGGFFLPDYRPLGLLIVDGRETNPLRKTDWGIFLIQDNRPRIIHTSEFQYGGAVSQAIQVGPRLVVGGRELQMKKQVARRSAVGVTFRDQVILLRTEDSDVYAQDLARIFSLPESRGGMECRDALTLDGGPSAQMYVEYKSLKIDIRGGWAVPNGIGVFKK